MDEPLAVALKFGFLAVLYLFLLWVARSALRDLARTGGRRRPSRWRCRGPRAASGKSSRTCARVARRALEVVAAMGHEPGRVRRRRRR